MGRRRKRRSRRSGPRLLFTLALLLLLAAAAYALSEQAPNPGRDPSAAPPVAAASGALRVHVVDVGQGDGTIWELPDGSIIVYDCGPAFPDAASHPMVRHLRDNLSRPSGARLHALVASHGHLDHIGGCEELFQEYVFEHVYETWYEGEDAPASYRRFLQQARDEGATLHTLASTLGDQLVLPPAAVAAGVRADILWPRALVTDWDRIAEASIVVRLTHGDTSFCFQGDIEREQERQIAQEGDECAFYLVGHHGSRHASDPVWLSVMDPAIAVVSFGTNAYGHPTSEALCRVQEAGAMVYATNRAGTVVVEGDGRNLRVARGEAEARDYCAEGAAYFAQS